MKKIVLSILVVTLSIMLVAPITAFACGLPDGCTPGYWKQSHHFGNWPTAFELCGDDTIAPQDCLFADVFGVSPTIPGLTLLEALKTGGGAEYALGRHAVAALLNSYIGSFDSSFDYCWNPGEVKEEVKKAYDAGTRRSFSMLLYNFAYDNEKNCPLGRAEVEE